jgi:CDP-4-dehydro-6-deoxyglucose reductase
MDSSPDRLTSEIFEAEVVSLAQFNDSVVKLRLMPVAGATMNYREGQFLSIELPDGGLRSYSMASAGGNDRAIELHIRLHRDGKFSKMLTTVLAIGDKLKVRGPFGTCVWQPPASERSRIVMLATGTGIAPLNALLEGALRAGCENPIFLYWGAASETDLYLSTRFDLLAERYKNFHYCPVLSNPAKGWQGKRGFVQHAASVDHQDLSDSRVYACGGPSMIAGAREVLVGGHGLKPEHFLTDPFVPSMRIEANKPRSTTGTCGAPVYVEAALPFKAEIPVRTLSASAGSTLLAALCAENLVRGVCGGNQSCGTCRVTVDEPWCSGLTPPTRTETRLLRSLEGSGPSDRLACQIVLESNLNGMRINIPRNAF